MTEEEKETIIVKYYIHNDIPESFKNLAEISSKLEDTLNNFGDEKDELKYSFVLNQEFKNQEFKNQEFKNHQYLGRGLNLEKNLLETYVKINKTIEELKNFEKCVDREYKKIVDNTFFESEKEDKEGDCFCVLNN